ncbi:MAG: RidA family protein [Chloroflexota bacterium]
MLHLSGQVGVPPEGPTPADFRGQGRQAIRNVETILQAADMTLLDIVKMTFYLTRREDIDALLDVQIALLDGVRRAVTTLLAAGLFSPDWFVEIDVVAATSP